MGFGDRSVRKRRVERLVERLIKWRDVSNECELAEAGELDVSVSLSKTKVGVRM